MPTPRRSSATSAPRPTAPLGSHRRSSKLLPYLTLPKFQSGVTSVGRPPIRAGGYILGRGGGRLPRLPGPPALPCPARGEAAGCERPWVSSSSASSVLGIWILLLLLLLPAVGSRGGNAGLCAAGLAGRLSLWAAELPRLSPPADYLDLQRKTEQRAEPGRLCLRLRRGGRGRLSGAFAECV